MFKQIIRITEQAATKASRRQFLGQMGVGAMTLAAVIGGILATPGVAQVAACTAESDIYCRGSPEGAHCQFGTMPGRCPGSPRCRCIPTRGSRRGPRGR